MEQYRASVGTFNRVSLVSAAYRGGLEFDPFGDNEPCILISMTLLNVTWKSAALALLLIVLSPTCLGSLLLIGGVESNPGPVTADSKRSVLAALCAGAPTSEIRDCLRCYDISKSTTFIERKMDKISVPTLVSTMTYLGVQGQECYVKAAIIRNLVCRIENLLPDTCFICESEYTIAKDEVPLLRCAFCGQGIHSPCLLQLLEVSPEQQDSFGPEEVQNKINPCNLPGFFYICHCCEKDKIPSDDVGKKKSHINREETLNHTTSLGGTDHLIHDGGAAAVEGVMVASGTESREPDISNEVEETPHRQQNVVDRQPVQGQRSLLVNPGVNSRPNNQNERPNNQNERFNNGTMQDVEAGRLRVCSFYRRGTCRYGISGKGCPRSHPKPCRRFMQHGNKTPRGCSEGRTCSKFHPQICNNSLTRGECLNDKCTFPHIKGTRRLNSPPKRTQVERQVDRGPEAGVTRMGGNMESGNNQEDFLSALAVLKKELMDSFETKILNLQAQIQQVGTAEAIQFYPQTYRYPQRAVPHQTARMQLF